MWRGYPHPRSGCREVPPSQVRAGGTAPHPISGQAGVYPNFRSGQGVPLQSRSQVRMGGYPDLNSIVGTPCQVRMAELGTSIPDPRSGQGGTPSQVRMGGVPHPRSRGNPIPGQDGGTPSQVRTGWGVPPS